MQFKDILNLPKIQQQLIAAYDGSLTSIIKNPTLSRVLNPCFSAHYFLDHVTPQGDMVSTKSTTNQWGYWDRTLTSDMVNNSYILAQRLKTLFKESGAFLVGHNFFISIDGQCLRISGMTIKNS